MRRATARLARAVSAAAASATGRSNCFWFIGFALAPAADVRTLALVEVIFAAAVPVFFPGHDYGLMVIIAAVWFGVAVDSALRARRAR